jgi:hypothetical protein
LKCTRFLKENGYPPSSRQLIFAQERRFNWILTQYNSHSIPNQPNWQLLQSW